MSKYVFTCPCGESMSVNEESRKDAIVKMKALMDKERAKEHIKAKHSHDADGMTVGHIYALIEQRLAPTSKVPA